MPPSRTRTAHDELHALEQRLAEARTAERDAEQLALAAQAAIETARDAVREAHDLGADATKPTEALEQAKRDAEQAALAFEGVGQRVQRATATRDTFLAEHGDRLLAELQPQCDEVTASMREHAQALLTDHAKWGELQRVVSRYLMAMRQSPGENAPGDHELAPVLRDIRRVLTGGHITSPAPHWQTRDAKREEEQRKAELREQRDLQAARG